MALTKVEEEDVGEGDEADFINKVKEKVTEL